MAIVGNASLPFLLLELLDLPEELLDLPEELDFALLDDIALLLEDFGATLLLDIALLEDTGSDEELDDTLLELEFNFAQSGFPSNCKRGTNIVSFSATKVKTGFVFVVSSLQ